MLQNFLQIGHATAFYLLCLWNQSQLLGLEIEFEQRTADGHFVFRHQTDVIDIAKIFDGPIVLRVKMKKKALC
jgi:hypothetical protein